MKCTFKLLSSLVLMSLTACQNQAVERNVTSEMSRVNQSNNTICLALKEAVTNAWEETSIPGLSAAVVLPDQTGCSSAAGWADVNRKIKATPDTRFLSGSTGKVFVSATAIYLTQQGLLDLDDPVSKYLSDEPFFDKIPNGRTMTVRQLMDHTSGLADHVYTKEFTEIMREGFANKKAVSPRDVIKFVFDQEPLSKAGEVFHYSDTGYILLGLVIESASGRDYYDVLHEAIILPLALNSTSPSRGLYHDKLANGYHDQKYFEFSPKESLTADGWMRWDPATEWTGGGLVTKPENLARFAWKYYQGLAFEKPYLEQVLTAGTIQQKGDFKYGLGTVIFETSEGIAYGHLGVIPGYGSSMVYFPKLKLSISIQGNVNDVGMATRLAIREAVVKALKAD